MRRTRSTSRGRLALVAVLAAFGWLVMPATAEPTELVTATTIAGAPLGVAAAEYSRILGRPSFTTRLPRGVTRVTYKGGELHVFLRIGRGVALSTSSDEYRTHAGIGPCSARADLLRAYGPRLKLVRRGVANRPIGYVLGRLFFAVFDERVGAVMLGAPPLQPEIAVNGPQCGAGDED
jgi:hypothetical protein